ncbi:MAG: TIGR03619 family F420-dependent LLM class oxidoreductase [Dehalococcoidia bacterium]|nr:TIGR03619 family F420-dependent LLM class oxidoreductase [Dehalococcoidia bacterium]
MAIRIGIGSPSPMAREGRETFLRYLDALEAQGWDSVWFTDRIVGPAWVVDPLAAMAMAAARTERLKFGTGVLLMSMRSPVAAARALATIDHLSGGRIASVGVGVGQESTLEYDAMGVRKRERGSRLDEAIRVMRRLWAEERVTFEGDYQRVADAGVTPRPPRGFIPIWIGGRTEPAFRRAGRLGDGWLPSQVLPEDCVAGIARINGYAEAAGRSIPDDHYGVQLGAYIVERGAVPMDKVERHLLRRRTDVSIEALNLLGTAEQITARIREYVDAGITKFVLNPACPPDEVFDQMAALAEAVVQPFHAERARV